MTKHRFFKFFGPLILMVVLSVFWTIAFFVTSFIYDYFTLKLTPFMTQLINSLFGFFMFGVCFFIVTQMATRRGDGRRVFMEPVIDAMKKISSGNYNVSVPKISGHEHRDHLFNEIVDNFNQMAKDLGEMEEMRQQFVSNVSHEIQSPLTSIKGFAIALQNDQISNEQRKHYLQIIEKESERLSHLSDNLLELTTLEATDSPIDQKVYRLDEQIRHIVLTNEPQWKAKDLAITLELSRIEIRAQEELLTQVWMNLLNNAIKFTPKSGTIDIQATDIDHKIIVTVSDTGIGISKQALPHLFERFYKADKARSREEDGNGLGLSIVKKIIDLHGGSICINSEENAGTTIRVVLNNHTNKEQNV